MAREEVSVDGLLESQGAEDGSLLATIEAVADDVTRVRITPFVAGSGCSCEQAITVPKQAIRALFKTDDIHLCCGKKFAVVEIEFADDVLADVFRQLGESSPMHASQRMFNQGSGARSHLGGMLPGGFGDFGPGRGGRTAERRVGDCSICGDFLMWCINRHGDDIYQMMHCFSIAQTCYDRCREMDAAPGNVLG
jgi:hypothetical protein